MEDKDLQAIHNRLDELEKLIKTVKGEGISYKISIEHAEFHSPIVEHLDYHFDKLDVKEVSGALNLGNNFGVRVGQAIKKSSNEEDISEENIGKSTDADRYETETTSKPETKKRSMSETEDDHDSVYLGKKVPPPENTPQVTTERSIRYDKETYIEKEKPAQSGTSPPRTPTKHSQKTSMSENVSRGKKTSVPRTFTKLTQSKASTPPPFKVTFFPRGKKTSDQD